MGFDYNNLQIFTGNSDPNTVRNAIIARIESISETKVDGDQDAARSIVIGPPGRWIHVGDSAGSTERVDRVAFEALALKLSHVAPTMSVQMSDSAIVHFHLYENGSLVDKFGNGIFPFYRFDSEEASAPFRGDMEKWKLFLRSHESVESLREAWSQDGYADTIVESTAKLFGIHPELIQVGFTTFNEEDEIKYSDWLQDELLGLGQFDEFHFGPS